MIQLDEARAQAWVDCSGRVDCDRLWDLTTGTLSLCVALSLAAPRADRAGAGGSLRV